MMETLQNRHDLRDEQWAKIEPIIAEKIGTWGGSNANDNRTFVNACLWIIRTGARGVTCPLNMENLTQCIDAINVGVTNIYGIIFLLKLLMMPIWNG